MDSPSLSPALRETTAVFAEHTAPLTTPEVAADLDLERRTVYARLDRLVELGEIETKKVGANARVWWQPAPTGAESAPAAEDDPQAAFLSNPEREFRLLVEHIPNGAVALVDESLRYRIVGGSPIEATAKSSEDLEGERLDVVLPEPVADVLVPKYEAALAGEASSFEPEIGDRSYRCHVHPVREDGEIVAAMGMSQDVTEQRARERDLRLYEAIVDTVGDGIYVLDDEYRFVMVNDAYVELTGYDREELLGAHASLVVSDETMDESADLTRTIEDAGGSAVLEADVHRADGSRVRAESRFTAPEFDDPTLRKVGVVRDVSDRVERERELQHRVRQQAVVSDLGQRALEEPDLDVLFEEVVEAVAETLDTDFCKVLELHSDANRLRLREGVGWADGLVGEATVSAVEDDSQAAHTLGTEAPVIVEDLTTESRFSGPDLLRDHDVRSGISTIIGAPDDPWGILGTHDRDTREFSEQDATFVQAVANVLAAAVERHSHDRRLVRQREQLSALNSLNEVVREISSAVIEESTREEIERTVCERLAATDSYLFAWTGDVDPATQTVELRTEAGVEGYLDDMRISVDPADDESWGATGRALRTGSVQVTHDIETDERYDPWREFIDDYGYRSSAAIPIVHEGTLYGALNVYAARPAAFTGEERTVIAQLGEVVGHAIAATERKQALMSDDLVELEFQIEDVFAALDVAVETEGRITLDHAVPAGDDSFLVYGSASDDAFETVETLVASLPEWESVAVRSDGDPVTFELRMTDPPVLSVLASLGGSVDSVTVESGEMHLLIHLPPSVEVRRVIDAVEDTYPTAEMVRRRQITRSRERSQPLQRQFATALTDRQRTALEAAYHAGFFEWPRNASAEDVADSLGVAPSTFHQHLRKAERKVFDELFPAPV
ncbi:bacterio-opsin activator domain-containing protein [Salinarchaeum laminariae]|uniref:bacterio-opsin activator domain-containing protein n=1 Tax=Salinarchaeum laminariae TaxID=869888 RepID=UPI0020BE8269|nr:bacterio-opsin activator domain-containing protein [Salinarchaeum laminariae]